jgi:atypical dual specificity phosphatase
MAIIRSFKACDELVSRLSPPVNLFKFPRTAHLLDLGAATEDDLYFTDGPPLRPSTVRPFSVDGESTIIITEKVDGANLGISLNETGKVLVQNRAHWVNSKTHFQFKKLDLWIDEHREGLYQVLAVDETFPQRYVLFGEWMVCTHSINYSRLPDQFLAFDLYDRTTETFASRDVLEERLRDSGVHLVPVLEKRSGHSKSMPTDDELRAMVQQPSNFYDGRVEGVYLKLEKGGRVIDRGKVVRGDFIAGNEHWTKGNLTLNGIVKESNSD